MFDGVESPIEIQDDDNYTQSQQFNYIIASNNSYTYKAGIDSRLRHTSWPIF